MKFLVTYTTTTGKVKTVRCTETQMLDLTRKLDERIEKGTCLGYCATAVGRGIKDIIAE